MTDLIEEQLSFVDNKEIRKVARINGIPLPPTDRISSGELPREASSETFSTSSSNRRRARIFDLTACPR